MAEWHTDPAARLDRLISRVEPEFQKRFREAVQIMLAASGSLSEVAQLILMGRTQEALTAVEAAAAHLAGAWPRAYVISGEAGASFVSSRIGITVGFDQVNERAVAQMRVNRLRMIRQFTQQQREATRQALVAGTELGLNPREQARLFRQSIGLTDTQVRAVANYRRLLTQGSSEALTRELRDKRFDSTVRGAIERGDPLTQRQINTMTQRYHDRYLRYRSEVIARTEALGAVHAGTEEMYRQAIEEGALAGEDLIRQWNPANDARVRDPAHTLMRGQQRGLQEAFTSGVGNLLMRPGDSNAPASEIVQCRCRVSTRFRATERAESGAVIAA